MMMMEAMVPVMHADIGPLGVETGNAARAVQAGLALHADRLQRIGVARTADQEVAATADAERGIGTDATIAAGERAVADRTDRCIHRPGELGALGDAEIEAETANRGQIRLRPAAFALEDAL